MDGTFKIDITYPDGTTESYGDDGRRVPSVPKPGENNPNPSAAGGTKNGLSKQSAVVLGFGIQSAKKAVNFITTNYGELFQDSIAQTKINTNMRALGYASAIAGATAVGGLIGGAVALGGIAVNEVLEAVKSVDQLRKQRITQSEQYRRLGGVRTSGGR